jgi:hypothetical protein
MPFSRRGTIMMKKWVFTLLFLAGLVIGEFFGPPILGQGVGAAPLSAGAVTSVDIRYNTTPPETMCVGDSAPVSFVYQIERTKTGKSGVTVESANTGFSANLIATATSGTISPSKWSLFQLTGSDTITATYTAEKTGTGRISISAGGSVPITGTPTVSFTVVECDLTISFAAGQYSGSGDTYSTVEFTGKGGAAIDRTTTKVTGGGTVKYKMMNSFGIKWPGVTCDKMAQSTTDATFKLVRSTAVSTTVTISIEFSEFTSMPVEVKCVDSKGVRVSKTLIDAKKVDLNSEVKLTDLLFNSKIIRREFTFGESGPGVIWLIKRKGKGK